MNWDYPNPDTLDVAATAADIDGLNHTNNAVYVKWCEQAAWAHSERLGLALVSADGKARMQRRFQAVRASDGATVLRGGWELVCIQLSSGRVSRLPDEFRDAYLPAVVPEDCQ